MKAVIIPWQESPDFQMEIALDRFVYLLRARWNTVALSWGVDLLTRAQTPVLFGIRLVQNAELILGRGEFTPAGSMFVLGSEPNYSNMVSGSSQLVYYGTL
jgi:hypothetical protein